MKLRAIFIIVSLLWGGCVWCMRDALNMSQPLSGESAIVGQIISNFLKTYFSDEKMFVSVILVAPGSEHLNRSFRMDFSHNVIDSVVSAGFAYNVLDNLDNDTHSNQNAFNLIIAHDGVELR